jgi:hypothetical protein
LKAYYLPSAHKPSLEAIDDLLHAAQDSAALVFLVLESEDTYNSCVLALNALDAAQNVVHSLKSAKDDPWLVLNIDLGRATRTFQNAARRELGIIGPAKDWQNGESIERQEPQNGVNKH